MRVGKLQGVGVLLIIFGFHFGSPAMCRSVDIWKTFVTEIQDQSHINLK